MKQNFRLTEEAEQDLYSAAQYIAEDNPDAAVRFLNAFAENCDLLSEMPGTGSTPRLSGEDFKALRMKPITPFTKYLIFYRPYKQEGIEIVRVIHAAQNYPTFFQ